MPVTDGLLIRLIIPVTAAAGQPPLIVLGVLVQQHATVPKQERFTINAAPAWARKVKTVMLAQFIPAPDAARIIRDIGPLGLSKIPVVQQQSRVQDQVTPATAAAARLQHIAPGVLVAVAVELMELKVRKQEQNTMNAVPVWEQKVQAAVAANRQLAVTHI